MIKKLNIHFRSALRKKLETEEKFKYCAGFRQALVLPNHILMFCMDERRAIGVYMKHNTIKGLEDLLDGCGHESKELTHAFQESIRIQAVIGLTIGDSVDVEILFYSRKDKTPTFSMHVAFSYENADVTGSGMRVPSTRS